jgi:ZIP family zinc transporter
LVSYPELLLLGAIAGFTIFLGLPLAVIRNISSRKKGFLNAVAIGILIFLTVDVFSHAWESVQDIVKGVALGASTIEYSMLAFVAMFGGIAI